MKIKENIDYCLNCKPRPCAVKGCPLGNNISEFIQEMKKDNLKEAYKILSKTTVLPAICGKICPHTKQCQGSCIRGIKGNPVEIGLLEAELANKFVKNENVLTLIYENEKEEKYANKKVAVIGGGPAGLTCAAFLAKKGVQVTIYEKYNYLGGLLVHGIPEFRLSKETVENSVDRILELGIEVKYNCELGKNLELAELENKYDKIFLAIGANVSTKMGVKGEELEGVYGGNQLLEYNLHPNYEGKIVSVIGGGNVAMDCARTIKKLGAKEVKVIYRRARSQMPAEDIEVEDAIEEGVEFLFQNNIVEIKGDTKVEKLELIKTELVQKEGDTRLSPVDIEGSNYEIDMDYIVMALGSSPESYVSTFNLNQNKWGNIEVNENYQTSNPNIYAAGDLIGGKGTVAWAAFYGREAADKILQSLT